MSPNASHIKSNDSSTIRVLLRCSCFLVTNECPKYGWETIQRATSHHTSYNRQKFFFYFIFFLLKKWIFQTKRIEEKKTFYLGDLFALARFFFWISPAFLHCWKKKPKARPRGCGIICPDKKAVMTGEGEGGFTIHVFLWSWTLFSKRKKMFPFPPTFFFYIWRYPKLPIKKVLFQLNFRVGGVFLFLSQIASPRLTML